MFNHSILLYFSLLTTIQTKGYEAFSPRDKVDGNLLLWIAFFFLWILLFTYLTFLHKKLSIIEKRIQQEEKERKNP